ncbi:Tof1p [Sugiyamaella lignohabitans]|uniref:Topoisomerase 1-associated factor 1 n=1 Tax=Sugiyamaella lignohabitans TaxID=796027 RepID=A0A167CHG9_9ASCO|nr:Tof1p [Sugiyamaella lignohabitans]ANB11704.1 Tof1p [Sugiyamaella lignohabitans]
MDFFEDDAYGLGGVDPEIKAHITNLVSALGGPDFTDPFKVYKLGDDALACLRDLKRWLKGYDERLDRWDIARALSETKLVPFDLIEILTLWEERSQSKTNPPTKNMDRIALACLELLVPLTWPLELNKLTSTTNHYRHAPHLELARARYKRAVLNHPKKLVFRAIIRLAIPSLKLSKIDRTPRDNGIIKLVVFFIRNILSIEAETTSASAKTFAEWESFGDDISRTTTINCFNKQRVLDFIITLGAGIGHNFEVQDTGVLESVFYLLHNIPVSDIIAPPPGSVQPVKKRGDLSDLLAREKDIRRDIQRHAPSRHNRFGTMISMDIMEKGRLSVSGQGGLWDTSATLDKVDTSKKWHKRAARVSEYGVSKATIDPGWSII